MTASNEVKTCGCGAGECRRCWTDMVTNDYRKDGKRSYCKCNHPSCGTCNIYKKIVAWPVTDGHLQGKAIACPADEFYALLPEPLQDPTKDRVCYQRHRTDNGWTWSLSPPM